jgi:hypothetical protein
MPPHGAWDPAYDEVSTLASSTQHTNQPSIMKTFNPGGRVVAM